MKKHTEARLEDAIVDSLTREGGFELVDYRHGPAAGRYDKALALDPALVLGLIVALWRPLLAVTVHEELARVEGLPVTALRLTMMLLIAVVIAVAMKFVGALIITSLLIIPAATARRFSQTPEQMAGFAALAGCLAVLGGLALSWYQDTPAGPSVVVCATTLFVLSQFKRT